MRIETSPNFERDLDGVRNAALRRRARNAVATIQAASAVHQIPGVRRVQHPRILYYRVRIGKYRLVFQPVGDTAVLTRFGLRKDVYKNLPG